MNSLPPCGKKAKLEPPLPLEILTSDPLSPLEFPTTFHWGAMEVWIFSGTAQYRITSKSQFLVRPTEICGCHGKIKNYGHTIDIDFSTEDE